MAAFRLCLSARRGSNVDATLLEMYRGVYGGSNLCSVVISGAEPWRSRNGSAVKSCHRLHN